MSSFQRWHRARSRPAQQPDEAGTGTHEVKVYSAGLMGVPTSALKRIGVRQRLAIWYDKDSRCIALTPAPEDDPESFAVNRNGESNNLIGVQRLLNVMGWLNTGVYPARVEGSRLIIDLREESIIR